VAEVVVEYIQDYVVALLPVIELGMDVNAYNIKACNL